MCRKPPNIMWSRKYVVPEICRPGDNMSARNRRKYVGPKKKTGENMSAQKKIFGGAAPEPPRTPLLPPRTPGAGAQTLLLVQRI
jgi:hypothetical protein